LNRSRDVGYWHEPDQLDRSEDVRCSGYTGSGVSTPSGPLLTRTGGRKARFTEEKLTI